MKSIKPDAINTMKSALSFFEKHPHVELAPREIWNGSNLVAMDLVGAAKWGDSELEEVKPLGWQPSSPSDRVGRGINYLWSVFCKKDGNPKTVYIMLLGLYASEIKTKDGIAEAIASLEDQP